MNKIKTIIYVCFLLAGTFQAFKSAGAIASANISYAASSHAVRHSLGRARFICIGGPDNKTSIFNHGPTCHLQESAGTNPIRPSALDSVTRLLRLQLYINQYNYDEIVIGFNSGAKTTYDYNEDSKYMPGINAAEGLASYSSDGVPLSINLVPCPEQKPEVIRLDVEAESSGPFTFKRTQFDALPQIYSVWLKDSYKKDSINLSVDSSYAFNINKSDSASFGSNRFTVIITQQPAAVFKLVGFNVAKSSNGAQISWDAQNEENNTTFAIERSSDGGLVFETLDSLKSTGSGTYSYTDNTPPVATDEYRLKSTDLNGTVSFSSTITIIYGNVTNTITGNISLYPNPTSNIINLAINHNGNNSSTNTLVTQANGTSISLAESATNTSPVYSIKIINISGSIVKTATSSAATWQENIASLSPGTYIITIVNNNGNKLIGRSTFVKL